MEDTEERLEDQDLEDEGGEEQEEGAPTPVATETAGGEVESSLDELLSKREEARPPEEEEEEESMLSLGPEERLEPLAVKVIPPQPTEFVCKKCYLVKHRSQLADKNRMYCRDCA
jgi:hypothetical protein